MKTIQIEIPEDKEAKWVNGVLTLVDKQPIEFKFKVGDRVVCTTRSCYGVMEITQQLNRNGGPWYRLEYVGMLKEDELELYAEPQDITERIKTFEDACYWCMTNNRAQLVDAHHTIIDTFGDIFCVPKDILAYLRLRIITCALNEGWEPTFEGNERRFSPRFICEENEFKAYDVDWKSWMLCSDMATKHIFKSEKLAKYAATQFKDIYMDFCYKGKV